MKKLPLLMFVVAICVFQLVVFKKERQIQRLLAICRQANTNTVVAQNIARDWRALYFELATNGSLSIREGATLTNGLSSFFGTNTLILSNLPVWQLWIIPQEPKPLDITDYIL